MSQYNRNQINSNAIKQDEAFEALMELVAPANKDEAIRLWVQGTYAARWQGWHSHAIESHREEIAKQLA